MKEDFKYGNWEQLHNMKTAAEHFIENIFTCTIFLPWFLLSCLLPDGLHFLTVLGLLFLWRDTMTVAAITKANV